MKLQIKAQATFFDPSLNKHVSDDVLASFTVDSLEELKYRLELYNITDLTEVPDYTGSYYRYIDKDTGLRYTITLTITTGKTGEEHVL